MVSALSDGAHQPMGGLHVGSPRNGFHPVDLFLGLEVWEKSQKKKKKKKTMVLVPRHWTAPGPMASGIQKKETGAQQKQL